MYRPPAFATDDDDALALVAARPLAHLVAVADDGVPIATPVPLIVRGDSLVGHLARPNPVLRAGGPALAIFTGDDAYVTPRWYPGKPIDGKVVPTWNYTTVHIAGSLVVHDDPEWTLQVVTDLSDHFESGLRSGPGTPWQVADAPADWVTSLARGIVGIELVDLHIVGKHKMSQNRSVDDRLAVASGLDGLDGLDALDEGHEGAVGGAAAVAAAIRATIPDQV